MIGVFGGVRSTPGLSGVCSAPGPEFGVHHQLTAYDCEHPTLVQALKLPMYCLTQKTKDDTTNQTTDLTTTDKDLYQLLQRATYHEFEAHQCIQTRSRFFYSCVWGVSFRYECSAWNRTTCSYSNRFLHLGRQDQHVRHRGGLLGSP